MTSSIISENCSVNLIADAKKQFTESFIEDLSARAGGELELLAMTSQKPRGQVEFIVQGLFPEKDQSQYMVTACRLLLDKESLFNALEALTE